jgi:hypothetical protein
MLAVCPPVSLARTSAPLNQESDVTPSAVTTLPPQYIGIWKGQVTQNNPSVQWEFIVSITDGTVNSVVGTTANITYACGGKLTLLQVDSNSIRLHVENTYGNCLGGEATISLLTNNSISYNGTNTAAGIQWNGDGAKTSGSDTKIPSSYSGIWEGSATEMPPEIQFTALFGITNGELASIVGTSAYPSVGCGAELTLTNVNANSIELSQKILYGNCLGGIITLSLTTTNTLDYRWHSPDNSLSSVGILKRISAPLSTFSKVYLPYITISPKYNALQSTNYAGYAVAGTSANPIAYKDLIATWRVPEVVECGSSESSLSATWAGFLDSIGTNTTVPDIVQIGTQSTCGPGVAGSQKVYFAVWQVYNRGKTEGPQRIYTLPIFPGNQVKVEVKSYCCGEFGIDIWNITLGSLHWQKVVSGDNSSKSTSVAACIQEAPAPRLTHFSSVTITCIADNHPMGSAGRTLYKYVMAKANTGNLSGSGIGDTFTVDWLHH